MGEHDFKVFIQMFCTTWNFKTVLSLQPTKMAFYHYLRHRRSILILFLSQNPFNKTVILNWLNHAQIFSHLLLLCFV